MENKSFHPLDLPKLPANMSKNVIDEKKVPILTLMIITCGKADNLNLQAPIKEVYMKTT